MWYLTRTHKLTGLILSRGNIRQLPCRPTMLCPSLGLCADQSAISMPVRLARLKIYLIKSSGGYQGCVCLGLCILLLQDGHVAVVSCVCVWERCACKQTYGTCAFGAALLQALRRAPALSSLHISPYTSAHAHAGRTFGILCTLMPPFAAERSGTRIRATQDIHGWQEAGRASHILLPPPFRFLHSLI